MVGPTSPRGARLFYSLVGFVDAGMLARKISLLVWRQAGDDMYGKNSLSDAWRFFRAVLTNQLARGLPHLYVKLTGQTGRGQKPESVQQIAEYFWQCFHDYFDILGVPHEQIEK